MPYVFPIAAAVYPYITSWIHPWKRRRDDARTPEPGSGLQPVAEVAADEILGAQDVLAEEVAREPAVRPDMGAFRRFIARTRRRRSLPWATTASGKTRRPIPHSRRLLRSRCRPPERGSP